MVTTCFWWEVIETPLCRLSSRPLTLLHAFSLSFSFSQYFFFSFLAYIYCYRHFAKERNLSSKQINRQSKIWAEYWLITAFCRILRFFRRWKKKKYTHTHIHKWLWTHFGRFKLDIVFVVVKWKCWTRWTK